MKLLGIDKRPAFYGTYSAADTLLFSQLKSEEDWTITREPVSAPVSGAGGVYDFFDGGSYATNSNYPPGAMTLKKKSRLQASSNTYATIETALDELRFFTLAQNVTTLWALRTDGTYVFTYAKTTALASNQRIGAYTYVDVEISLYCPTGLWYGTERTATEVINIAGTGTVLTETDVLVYGNYPQPVKAAFTVAAGTTGQVAVSMRTAGGFNCLSTVTGITGAVTFDSATNAIDPSAAYATLTRQAGQSATFLWVDPRKNISGGPATPPYENTLGWQRTGTGALKGTLIYTWRDAYLA